MTEERRSSPFAVIRSLVGMTLVSRVLGFVRDVLMATALGTGLAADAFFLAWMVPNLFRRLFGEGAFAAALVPVFVEAREQGDQAGAHRLVSGAVVRLALFLTALVLVLELLFSWLLGPGQEVLRGSGLGQGGWERTELVLQLARILLPYMIFICVAGLLGGALNALDEFSVPAAAPVVFNVVWIAALLLGAWMFDATLERVRFLAFGLVAGGVVQLGMHTHSMRRVGYPVQPVWQVDPERLRRVRNLFLSLALGMALFQLNALVDGLIAYALCPEGGVSALYYANRLVQLPIGVLGVALSTAIFPELARLVKRGETGRLGKILDRGVVLGAFVSLPAAAGLAVLAHPIIETLFERGRFDATSTARTARVLLFLSPAVITACVTPVITRAFYAEEEVKTPVRIGAVCVLLNLILNLSLVGPLQEAGLALATSISQGTNLVLQVLLYRHRRIGRDDRPPTANTLKQVGLFLLLTALEALGAWATFTYVPGPRALRVGLAIAIGVVIYAGLAWLLKVQSMRLLLERRAQSDSAE